MPYRFSVKEWYRQARSFNKTAIPFLIGTKYDVFAKMPREEQEEITKVVRSLRPSYDARLRSGIRRGSLPLR